MEWIKAKDRLPSGNGDKVVWRFIHSGFSCSGYKEGKGFKSMFEGKFITEGFYDDIEWLDESDFFEGDRVDVINKILVNALRGLDDQGMFVLAMAITDRLPEAMKKEVFGHAIGFGEWFYEFYGIVPGVAPGNRFQGSEEELRKRVKGHVRWLYDRYESALLENYRRSTGRQGWLCRSCGNVNQHGGDNDGYSRWCQTCHKPNPGYPERR